MLPYIQAVAHNVNSNLPPAAASEIWAWLAHTPCGKRLRPADKAWIDLFDSIGKRDPLGMIAHSRTVLTDHPGPASAATEIAMLAGSVGLVCAGTPREADAFLTKNARRFFRKDQREVELRYLLGLTQPATRPPVGPCMSAAAGATSGATRSP
jgi:hypothetical protein